MNPKLDYYGRMVITSLMLIIGAWQLFNVEWYWIVIASVYTIILNDIFCHRICSHGMFKIDTDSKLYKVLCWVASVDMGYGPVKGVVMSHELHHIHSDKGPADIMNWRYHWYSTTIVSPLPRFNDVKPDNFAEYEQKQIRRHKELLTDPWTSMCCQYQVLISFITLALLAIFVPIVFFKIICLGRFMLTVMTGIAGSIGHMDFFPGSYRNYNTNDTSSNNIVFYYLFLGMYTGMLQNNHHGKPSAVKPNPKWWEFDTSLPIVLTFKYFMEKK